MQYRHRQFGTLVWAAVAPLVSAAIYVSASSGGALVIGIFVAFASAILLLFGWLTVSIDQTRLRAIFGIGLVRKSFPLCDIVRVEPVRNRWYYFWGIRWYGRGWLYNVSGLDAVEIELTSGKRARIGTDEPGALAAAIRAAIA